MAEIDEELTLLENKLKQLKLDYEQYFLGARPREPAMLRGEVQKLIMRRINQPIRNTSARFRFNTINSRFQCFRRQWDATLRQIEAGPYHRHVFKARLHERQREAAATGPAASARGARGNSSGGEGDLFESYRDAALACGQSVKGLTRAKLEAVVEKQRESLQRKLGCKQLDFRVVVEAGRVRLKASPGRG